MYYIINLAVPILYTILYVLFTSKPMAEAISVLPATYFLFSGPYWLWAAASAYFEASKATVMGAFTALHILWFVVCFLVLTSSSAESANGWFWYLLGSPLAIALGALAGKYASRGSAAA